MNNSNEVLNQFTKLYHGSKNGELRKYEEHKYSCLYVTPVFAYAAMYSSYINSTHGCVFEMTPVKSLSIFDANDENALEQLKAKVRELNPENTLVNQIKWNDLKTKDWSTVCFRKDEIRDDLLLKAVKALGYDGYLNIEWDEGCAENYAEGLGGCIEVVNSISIGIFDENLLEVVDEKYFDDYSDDELFNKCHQADEDLFIKFLQDEGLGDFYYDDEATAKDWAADNLPFLDTDEVNDLFDTYANCYDEDDAEYFDESSKKKNLFNVLGEQSMRKLKEARTRNPGRKDQINPTFIAQQTTIFFEDEGFYKVDYKAQPKPSTFRIFNDPTGIDLNINIAINGDYEDDILINTFFDSRCGSGYVIQTQTLEGPVEWAGFDKSEFKEDLEDAWVTAKKFFEANKDKHSLETWLNREVGQSISQDEIHDIIEKAYRQGPRDYFTKLLSREEFDAYKSSLTESEEYRYQILKSVEIKNLDKLKTTVKETSESMGKDDAWVEWMNYANKLGRKYLGNNASYDLGDDTHYYEAFENKLEISPYQTYSSQSIDRMIAARLACIKEADENLKESFKEDISNSYYVTPEQREEAMVKARAIHTALWNAGLQDIDMELESFISNQPNEKAWYCALVDGTAENFVDERTDEDWRQYLTESKRLKGGKSSRSALREALTQKQKRYVLNYVKENSFFPCDNGKNFYFLVPVDDKHIKMTPKFKKQLKDEGLYGNTFIGGMTDTAELPIDMMWLPIYGNPDRYVTKWLSYSFDSCFDSDLRDRGRGLSKRLDLDKISEVCRS